MIRVSFAALCFLTTMAFGQEATIRTTIVTSALGAPALGFQAFYKTGGDIKKFSAAGNSLGVPIQYEGPRRFVIRDSEAGFAPPVEGEKPRPPLAFVDLPEKSDNVLILAVVEGEGKIRMAAFDVSTSTLQKGDYRIFNFSHSTLSMILQKKKFLLPPGKDLIVKDESWHGTEPLAFPLEIATVEGNKAISVYSSFWEHWPERRNIMFMFDGTRRNEAIKFSSFDVEPPPPPKKEGE